MLTVWTGLAGTGLSLILALGFAATNHHRPLFRRLVGWLAPILALPHAALAVGLAFLIQPSGWIARLLSPWATGWTVPPDLWTDRDPLGIGLILGLALKETPYLMLAVLAGLSQIDPARDLAVARTMGYAPAMAWLKVVLPRLYPLLRLPIYAVLAYAVSVVDMALILAPASPPPLAVLILRWFHDPDLALRLQAAAASCLQLGLAGAAILAWASIERVVARIGRGWLIDGRRGRAGGLARRGFAALQVGAIAASVASIAAMFLWSTAARWRFPSDLPSMVSISAWSTQGERLADPIVTTLTLGLGATAIALVLTIACLENEQRTGSRIGSSGLLLLYLPLLLPQIAFLPGAQIMVVAVGLDGGALAVLWSHLLFVMPYVFLSLGDAYRRLDPRHAQTARSLGAGGWAVLWRVKLPLLLGPLWSAGAVGFAVSVSLYVPTLITGGGRFETLATETVGALAGADRRAIGVAASLQALLPLLAYAPALLIPAATGRRRTGAAP
jgi:putative thiamine transport system permease protein